MQVGSRPFELDRNEQDRSREAVAGIWRPGDAVLDQPHARHRGYRLPAPVTSGTVTVIGTAAGDVQMQRDGRWLTIGRLDPAGFTRLSTGAGTAVRIAFTPGGPPPAITEIVVH
jgi:hypothetical protein